MTHLCSVKVTHTKNTFSPVFAGVLDIGGATINIIHAAALPTGKLSVVIMMRAARLICDHESRCLPGRRNPASGPLNWHERAHLVGNFWRANPGHFPRVPKR
jgi:hypothetical protein